MSNVPDMPEHKVDPLQTPAVPDGPDVESGPARQATERERARIAEELERLVQLRLTPDSMALELYVYPGLARYHMSDRIDCVKRQATGLGVTAAIDEDTVRRAFASGKEKQWLVIARGTPAVPPVHGSVEVLVPSVPPLGKDRFHERPYVNQGDVLVLVTRASDGVPGVNLKGWALPSTAARRPAIPSGEHTVLRQEGETREVVAECDGLVYFDHMQFGVYPMQHVHSSALRYGAKVESDNSIVVRGNVPSGATIVSSADIYVSGDVDDSTLISTSGSITVLGCVTGHNQHHCTVRAKGDIMVASALHVDITGEQDVYIQTQARNSTIVAARNLILLTRLRSALYDVDLRIGGAVMPSDSANAPADVTSAERMAFDVECSVPAQLGMLEGQVVSFKPGLINELSVAVARLVLVGSPPLSANKTVYLKLQLPGFHPLQILGRTMAPTHDGRTMVGFRQMSHQDEAAITAYCLSLARKRIGGEQEENGENGEPMV